MTVPEALTSAIFTLQYTSTPDDADRVLNVAAARGVDPETCAALRAEWQRMFARTVTTLYTSDAMGVA